MAVKNHALDEKIVSAAREEFLEKGFRDASLHKIAQRAGTTTGALYTRYRNKDDLFQSLVREMLCEVGEHMEEMRDQYAQAHSSGDPAAILAAIRAEEGVYQKLLLRHKDACVLFFCRSDGSGLEQTIREMLERKSAETVAYLKSLSHSPDLDLDGVGLLISSQFLFFRQVLEKGYSPEKTLSCLRTVECYMDAGWKALFEAIL